MKSSIFTLTSGEHSVIPYPAIKGIPISLKNFPISYLIGAPPATIFLKFPPKASCIDLKNVFLLSIPIFLKKLLNTIKNLKPDAFPDFSALFHIFL